MRADPPTPSQPQAISFWTPGHSAAPAFGCSVHAVSPPPAVGPSAPGAASFGPLRGRVLGGTYEAVAERLSGELQVPPSAAMVLFAHGQGMEGFLERIRVRMSGVPLVGGAAARTTGAARGETRPDAPDVVVLLVDEGRWEARAINVHEPSGRLLEYETEGARRITRLRAAQGSWTPAADFYRSLQDEFALPETNCEIVTFSDLSGRNLHCGPEGSALACGSDLPRPGSRLEVRWTTPHHVTERLGIFAHPPRSLVFACAGLHGLLREPVRPGVGSLVVYMFGEVVPFDDGPRFANLMASRLTRIG